ncbi:cell division protein ZipA [Shewanella sp. OPT22]|nr:cell division protein ZipA [Shewanella sp. OPT22]
MEDLQLVFLIVGGLAILAVLIHGVWSIRRHQSNTIKDQKRPEIKRSEIKHRDSEGFDADGIGAVRVRKSSEAEKSAAEPQNTPEAETATAQRVEPVIDETVPEVDVELSEPKVEQPTQASLFEESTFNEPEAKVEEPKVEIIADPVVEETVEPEAEIDEELPDPHDVLVLHVMAKEGDTLKGAELLPCMLSLNFKFGEMNIFHRHEDNAGTGNVIFSVADMVNPGTFDPDNMEQFTSHGIVMFMRLPCHGEALRNFSIMLNSACQMADDLNAIVCDGQRQPWGDENKQDYIRRIKA